MGYGNYSLDAHAAIAAGRANQSRSEVFKQLQCHVLMNPKGLKVRESRDSAEHPASLPIMFALDVTGSMGDIPHLLAREELPNFMKLLTSCGVADPQVLFMAIGDANSDNAPVQVGQFETTAELMDQWLTWTYIESGGGGSGEESYELAFYVAAQHTDTDAWVKRKKKGYLFLTGDEFPYPAVSRLHIEALFGAKLDEDIPIEEVIAAAAETYHVFFLIPDAQRAKRCGARWTDLLGDHAIQLESPRDACTVAASIVGLTEQRVTSREALAKVLSDSGLAHDRVGSTIRAVQDYAATLDGTGLKTFRRPSTPVSAWWKRLFG